MTIIPRTLDAFGSTPLLKIYLDLFSHVCDYSWLVPFAKDIQKKHGTPFVPDILMKDEEIIRLKLHEREHASENSTPIEELREKRVILLSDLRMQGVSLYRHSSRTGTMMGDIAWVAFDYSRLSSLSQSNVERIKMIVQVTLFAIGYLHDIGKLSRKNNAKDDIYYILSLPRDYSGAERKIIQDHRSPEATDEVWERTFRIDPKTIPRILNLVCHYHHIYGDGSGYPSGGFPEDLNAIEKFLLSVIKLIDETEAGTALDRIYKRPKEVSEIVQEIHAYHDEGKITEEAMRNISKLLVDDGGLSNIRKLLKVPEIERTLRLHFHNNTIVFQKAIELITLLFDGDSVDKAAQSLLRENI